MVCACEDVGLAYPQIIPIVKAACDIAMQVGLPEARLPLADAVILVATSPKSNTAHNAINEAMVDLKAGRSGPIRAPCKTSILTGKTRRSKGSFTSIRMISRTAGSSSSICPMPSRTGCIITPPTIKMNRQPLPTGKRSKARTDPFKG